LKAALQQAVRKQRTMTDANVLRAAVLPQFKRNRR
jgi:hypothetical protein